MQILVLTRDGRKSIYETDRFGTVSGLKSRIGRNMNVPMGFSRLSYEGRILNNDCVLEDMGIKRMSTLELFWQPLVFTPKQFREKEMDLDKLEQKQRIVFSMTESYDHMVKKGGFISNNSSASGELHAGGSKEKLPYVKPCSSLQLVSQSPSKLHELMPDCEGELEELSSISSDGLDFLAAYRRPKGETTDTDVDNNQNVLDKDLTLEQLNHVSLSHKPQEGEDLHVNSKLKKKSKNRSKK